MDPENDPDRIMQELLKAHPELRAQCSPDAVARGMLQSVEMEETAGPPDDPAILEQVRQYREALDKSH
jgi:hypothetical protein